MDVLVLALLLLAVVSFALVMINVATGKVNLLALGLLAWVSVILVHQIHTMGGW